MDEAYRITLDYDGDRFTLKSMRKLAMRVPPAQRGDRRIGRFVELRGAKDEPLYRRQIGQLIPETVEFPTGDPKRPFGRTTPPARRLVTVLVPAHERALTLAIVDARGSRAGKAGKTGKAAKTKRAAAGEGGPRDLFTVKLPRAGEKG